MRLYTSAILLQLIEYYAEQLVAKIRERFGKRIEAILKVDSSSSVSSGSSCCNASHQELSAGEAVVFPASNADENALRGRRTQEQQGLSYQKEKSPLPKSNRYDSENLRC